jgi:mannose-1-phosphate guanylyltransferase
LKFQDKPKEFISNKINGGVYLFKTSILQKIPVIFIFFFLILNIFSEKEKYASLENDIFPQLLKEEQLFGILLNDFWIKLSSANDFLVGQCRYLDYLRRKNPQLLSKGENIFENVYIVLA